MALSGSLPQINLGVQGETQRGLHNEKPDKDIVIEEFISIIDSSIKKFSVRFSQFKELNADWLLPLQICAFPRSWYHFSVWHHIGGYQLPQCDTLFPPQREAPEL
ncbi:hypothetical protein TNCV_2190201 [Trichonephila clavipes]|uniref:Uncharacterized protein n=1 Tax=Trichonephila clavipes TaxID=2585209 RepID=A0A8X6R3I9_TRICX|nr:hypothetical protein TNCV_2190201 [Trichonephila clavipes]